MNKLTYRQAEDLILQAYFAGKIRIMNANFCFCGTLSPDSGWWRSENSFHTYPYTLPEYAAMELALFSPFYEHATVQSVGRIISPFVSDACIAKIGNYDEKLFAGMCAALDVLKQIHINRGEIIDQPVLVAAATGTEPNTIRHGWLSQMWGNAKTPTWGAAIGWYRMFYDHSSIHLVSREGI